MNLNDRIEQLIQRSIDGELSGDERRTLDQHLADHPEDAARISAHRHQSGLIAQAVPKVSAAHLRSLRAQAGAGANSGARTGARSGASAGPVPRLRLVASVAIFALGFGIGMAMSGARGSAPSGLPVDLTDFARHARAAHALYESEVLHPVEVSSDQKDHLQSWLSNRLGAPIIAPRLGETGYSLIGGRLLPVGNRASALFMYENQSGARLSLMATHRGQGTHAGQNKSFQFRAEGGYLAVSWQDGPWQYTLVGQGARKTMGQIARIAHGQLI